MKGKKYIIRSDIMYEANQTENVENEKENKEMEEQKDPDEP